MSSAVCVMLFDLVWHHDDDGDKQEEMFEGMEWEGRGNVFCNDCQNSCLDKQEI